MIIILSCATSLISLPHSLQVGLIFCVVRLDQPLFLSSLLQYLSASFCCSCTVSFFSVFIAIKVTSRHFCCRTTLLLHLCPPSSPSHFVQTVLWWCSCILLPACLVNRFFRTRLQHCCEPSCWATRVGPTHSPQFCHNPEQHSQATFIDTYIYIYIQIRQPGRSKNSKQY